MKALIYRVYSIKEKVQSRFIRFKSSKVDSSSKRSNLSRSLNPTKKTKKKTCIKDRRWLRKKQAVAHTNVEINLGKLATGFIGG
jgi:hypothetical protein